MSAARAQSRASAPYRVMRCTSTPPLGSATPSPPPEAAEDAPEAAEDAPEAAAAS